MKTWLFGLALLLISCAGYKPKPLTTSQIVGEVAYGVLHIADWGQTLAIASNDSYYEINPIIGRHPSRARVNLVMGTSLILHPIITWLLPDEYRWYWLGGTGIVKLGCVVHNHRIGLGFDF